MTTRGRTRFSRLQNKQLVNNGMVCVLHWYPLNAETVTFGHFAHLWRIVVSHHHCTAHLRHECKQSFVVDFVVCIEPGPRLLASGRIRRVNEKEGIGIIGKAAYNLEGISPSSLTVLHQAGAGCHDAASLHPVLNDGSEGLVFGRTRLSIKYSPNVLRG